MERLASEFEWKLATGNKLASGKGSAIAKCFCSCRGGLDHCEDNCNCNCNYNYNYHYEEEEQKYEQKEDYLCDTVVIPTTTTRVESFASITLRREIHRCLDDNSISKLQLKRAPQKTTSSSRRRSSSAAETTTNGPRALKIRYTTQGDDASGDKLPVPSTTTTKPLTRRREIRKKRPMSSSLLQSTAVVDPKQLQEVTTTKSCLLVGFSGGQLDCRRTICSAISKKSQASRLVVVGSSTLPASTRRSRQISGSFSSVWPRVGGGKIEITNEWQPLRLALLLLALVATQLALPVACLDQSSSSSSSTSSLGPSSQVQVKVGILLEESDHEQANMFIRTIKMINERREETIRQLLNALVGRQQVAPPTEPLEAEVASDKLAKNQPARQGSRARPQQQHEASSGGASESQSSFSVKLEPVIEFLSDRESSLEADSKVCQLVESGVRALVGPIEGSSIQHVQSICDNLEIPYFELRPFLGSPSQLWSSPPPLPPPMAPNSSSQSHHQHHLLHDEPSMNQRRPQLQNPDKQANHQQQQQQQQQHQPKMELQQLSLNLYPPAHLLNSAYIDLIYALNWTSFAIVYEDGNSMIKLQDLFRESSGSWTNKWRIKLFRHDDDLAPPSTSTSTPTHNSAGSGHHQAASEQSSQIGKQSTRTSATFTNANLAPNFAGQPNGQSNNKNNKLSTFRDVFWRVKASGERNILLDVKTENLYEALKHAQQVGLMTEEYSYLVTSLDLHMIDMENFKYSRTKITALSILHIPKASVPIAPNKPAQNLASSSASVSAAATATQSSSLQQDTMNDDAGKMGDNDVSGQPIGSQTSEMLNQTLDNFGESLFDELYLERLGVHVIQQQQQQQSDQFNQKNRPSKASGQRQAKQMKSSKSLGLVSDPFTISDSLNDNDLARREMLQSSPASMGLLPTVDRNNEQKLFEFFVQQQERYLSHVRLSTSSAILHDSLILYLLALNELADPSGSNLQGLDSGDRSSQVTCDLNSPPWPHGSSLVNFMRRLSFSGLTGQINFDQNGLRTEFKLNVMGLAPNIRPIKVGEWHSQRSLARRSLRDRRGGDIVIDSSPMAGASNRHISPKPSEANNNQQQQQQQHHQEELSNFSSYDDLSNKYEQELKRYTKMLADGINVVVPYSKSVAPSGSLLVNEIIFDRLYKEQADQIDTLTVTAKLSQPYFMLKETPNRLEGNDQYEGFAVDLIHELSKLVNFRYKWRVVADNKYGSKEIYPNGTVVWNGMIGEIVRGQADLAIVDLTITAQREEAVDFTLPFMNTGISILFKKPTTKVTTLFSFLSPFSSDVWAYVLAAYCGISAILFLVGHLSPYEWANPHPCRHISQDDETTVLKNQFSLLNSFWFTIGSLMQQGSDLTPRSMSTRTIAGIWYFFTLIMISSYTANLAAFLTVEKVVYPIENVRDLSQQQEIKYGCVESGSTCTFFHDSQIDTYKRIDETMSKFRTYVRSNDEGQKRVGEGKFAFFMESTTIEYIIERNCNLTQIGGLIDSKGYGLATSKKSRLKRPYRTLLNEGILHLQETGMLHVLKNRWWKERRGGGTCTDDGKGGGVTELSLANVGGVFVVLLGGLGISFLVAIAEFMWRSRRSGSSRDRMCEEMMNDLKFALACKSSTKPIATKDGPTRGRSGRRLVYQQASSASQYSGNGSNDVANGPSQELMLPHNHQHHNHHINQQQQQHHLQHQKQHSNAAKDCDPILVHAMITMLMQQQAEQQQAASSLANLTAQQYHQPLVQSSLDTTTTSGSNNITTYKNQPTNERIHFHQNQLRKIQQNPDARVNNSAGSTELDQTNSGDRRLPIDGPPTNRLLHGASSSNNNNNDSSSRGQQHCPWDSGDSRSEANRRRLLFAQQTTLDTMADESLLLANGGIHETLRNKPRM